MAANNGVEEIGLPVQRGWQLAMAFGQGAGTMPASREGLCVAFSAYGHLVADEGRWNTAAVLILEWARVLGRSAAAHALRAGRCVIDAEDVEFALRAAQSSQIEPLAGCPLTDIVTDP
jgi:hypothetical protein